MNWNLVSSLLGIAGVLLLVLNRYQWYQWKKELEIEIEKKGDFKLSRESSEKMKKHRSRELKYLTILYILGVILMILYYCIGYE